MTQLHSLVRISHRKAKRLGRGLGSAKGSKSGRGTTRHQGARTDIPLHFEGGQGRLVKKYPLLRGKGKNKSRSSERYTVKLSALTAIKDTSPITLGILIARSIVPKDTRSVKVVYDHPIKEQLTVQLPVSAQSAEAIRSAGGSVIS